MSLSVVFRPVRLYYAVLSVSFTLSISQFLVLEVVDKRLVKVNTLWPVIIGLLSTELVGGCKQDTKGRRKGLFCGMVLLWYGFAVVWLCCGMALLWYGFAVVWLCCYICREGFE